MECCSDTKDNIQIKIIKRTNVKMDTYYTNKISRIFFYLVNLVWLGSLQDSLENFVFICHCLFTFHIWTGHGNFSIR